MKTTSPSAVPRRKRRATEQVQGHGKEQEQEQEQEHENSRVIETVRTKDGEVEEETSETENSEKEGEEGGEVGEDDDDDEEEEDDEEGSMLKANATPSERVGTSPGSKCRRTKYEAMSIDVDGRSGRGSKGSSSSRSKGRSWSRSKGSSRSRSRGVKLPCHCHCHWQAVAWLLLAVTANLLLLVLVERDGRISKQTVVHFLEALSGGGGSSGSRSDGNANSTNERVEGELKSDAEKEDELAKYLALFSGQTLPFKENFFNMFWNGPRESDPELLLMLPVSFLNTVCRKKSSSSSSSNNNPQNGNEQQSADDEQPAGATSQFQPQVSPMFLIDAIFNAGSISGDRQQSLLHMPAVETDFNVFQFAWAPGEQGVDIQKPEFYIRSGDKANEESTRESTWTGWVDTFPVVTKLRVLPDKFVSKMKEYKSKEETKAASSSSSNNASKAQEHQDQGQDQDQHQDLEESADEEKYAGEGSRKMGKVSTTINGAKLRRPLLRKAKDGTRSEEYDAAEAKDKDKVLEEEEKKKEEEEGEEDEATIRKRDGVEFVVLDASSLLNNRFFIIDTPPRSSDVDAISAVRIVNATIHPRNINVNIQVQQGYGTKTTATSYLISMVQLPERPMRGRVADDRVGYFNTVFREIGFHDEQRHRLEGSPLKSRVDDTTTLINRRRLPENGEPMKYYIDPSVPSPWRSYIKEGIEAWNVAFREAGFDGDTIKGVLPTDPDFPEDYTAGDIRYSSVSWAVSVGTTYALGPSTVDPRSGEILNGDIVLTHGWVASWLGSIDTAIETTELDTDAAAHHRHNSRSCSLQREAQLQLEAVLAKTLMSHSEQDWSMDRLKEIVGAGLRDVTMHEVGHTLGLRHNFKGSLAVPFDQLGNPEVVAARGLTSSVMDYLPMNFASMKPSSNGNKGSQRGRLAQGQQRRGQNDQTDKVTVDPQLAFTSKIGAYDVAAIVYGYKKLAAQKENQDDTNNGNRNEGYSITTFDVLSKELDQLAADAGAFGTDEDIGDSTGWDPDNSVFDLGDDPLRFFEQRLELVANAQQNLHERGLIGENWDHFSKLQKVLAREILLAGRYLCKYIGGVRSEKTISRNSNQLQRSLRDVSATQQLEALRIISNVFRGRFRPNFFNGTSSSSTPRSASSLFPSPEQVTNYGAERVGVCDGLHQYCYGTGVMNVHSLFSQVRTGILDTLLQSHRLTRVATRVNSSMATGSESGIAFLMRSLSGSILGSPLFHKVDRPKDELNKQKLGDFFKQLDSPSYSPGQTYDSPESSLSSSSSSSSSESESESESEKSPSDASSSSSSMPSKFGSERSADSLVHAHAHADVQAHAQEWKYLLKPSPELEAYNNLWDVQLHWITFLAAVVRESRGGVSTFSTSSLLVNRTEEVRDIRQLPAVVKASAIAEAGRVNSGLHDLLLASAHNSMNSTIPGLLTGHLASMQSILRI